MVLQAGGVVDFVDGSAGSWGVGKLSIHCRCLLILLNVFLQASNRILDVLGYSYTFKLTGGTGDLSRGER